VHDFARYSLLLLIATMGSASATLRTTLFSAHRSSIVRPPQGPLKHIRWNLEAADTDNVLPDAARRMIAGTHSGPSWARIGPIHA
jgi:hypothetical protein